MSVYKFNNHSEVSFQLMLSYLMRKQSFENLEWNVLPISCELLAEAGFHRGAFDGEAECAFCHLVLSKWTEGSSPLLKHIIYSPRCPFVRNNFIMDANVLKKCQIFLRALGRQANHQSLKDDIRDIAVNIGIRIHTSPRYPKFISLDVRLNSLPLTLSAFGERNLLEYAKAGFFFKNSAYLCYHCGLNISEWCHEIHDPYTTHAASSPNCEHILIFKGERFTNQAKKDYEKRKAAIRNFLVTPVGIDLYQKRKYLSYSVQASLLDSYMKNTNMILSLKSIENHVRKRRALYTDLYEQQHGLIKRAKIYGNIRSSSTSEFDRIDDNDISNRCKVCLAEEARVTVLPCSHLLLCTLCAAGIDKCPICRTCVKATVLNFIV